MKNWIQGILGLVVVGAVFGNLSDPVLTWTLAISGAIISVIGFWSAATEGEVRIG